MQEDDKPAHGRTVDPLKGEKDVDVWTSGPQVSSAAADKSHSADAPAGRGATGEQWERDVVNRLAFAALNEQRRARRWNIFFKSLFFIYLFALFFYIPFGLDSDSLGTGRHSALVELEGVIAADAPASADNLVSGLRNAFKDKDTVGVILRINSPGGSPVQSAYVFDEIKRLRREYPDTKLYAVITDICASGGYFVAAAADEIYADKASIVGSIGVLMDGFGFVDSMQKLGVERRLMTAGEHKGILDPFSPLKKDEVKHVQGLLDNVHRQFIDKVKEGRGERLADKPELFSGLFWNGEQGLELGLVDGFGSSSYVAREIIGAEKIVNYTPRPDLLEQFASSIGVSMGRVLAAGLGVEFDGLR